MGYLGLDPLNMGVFENFQGYLFVLFSFGATPNNAQGLLLALYSGIILGSTWGTAWDVKDQTLVGCVQANTPYLLYHCSGSQGLPFKNDFLLTWERDWVLRL